MVSYSSSLVFTTHSIFGTELRKLDLGSFHPAEEKVHSPRGIRANKGASHSNWTIPTPMVICERSSRRKKKEKGRKKREKERATMVAMDMIMGMANTISDIFPLLSGGANNSAIVERAKTRKNPLLSSATGSSLAVLSMWHTKTPRSAATICFTCVDALGVKALQPLPYSETREDLFFFCFDQTGNTLLLRVKRIRLGLFAFLE